MDTLASIYAGIGLLWGASFWRNGRPRSRGEWLGLLAVTLAWPLMLGWLVVEVVVRPGVRLRK